MKNFVTKSNDSRRGFTLIELLVVIAIIGLLASIVLASLNSARKKSRDARRIADLKQLQNALELYANDNQGRYPSNATTGTAPGQSAATGMSPLAPNYISVIPVDPLGGTLVYVYRTDSAGANTATLYCMGTRMEGTIPTPASTCKLAVSTNSLAVPAGAGGTGTGDTDTSSGTTALTNYEVGN